MATAVECQHCGQRYSVREDLLGKRMKCKACGQATALVAALPRPKASTSAPPEKLSSPSKRRPLPKQRAEPKSTKPSSKRAAQRARSGAGAVAEEARNIGGTSAPKSGTPTPIEPTELNTSAAQMGMPAPEPGPNLLDLLDDSAFSSAASAPLRSGVMLKASAPALAEKPKAKKKKNKKSRSGESSDNTKVLLRMSGGVLLILLGLGALGRAAYAIANIEETGFLPIRWIVGGVTTIGSGVKLIVG